MGTHHSRDPFTELIGLQWDEIGPSAVRAHLEVDDRHHQPMGIVHGGVYASIVEVTASVGAYLNAAPGTVTVGVNNNCNFLRYHRTGRLDALARPIAVQASRQVWEVHISRQVDDEVIAVGTVELAAVPVDRFGSAPT